jgi:hypothetical protein
MLRLFSELAARIGAGPDREASSSAPQSPARWRTWTSARRHTRKPAPAARAMRRARLGRALCADDRATCAERAGDDRCPCRASPAPSAAAQRVLEDEALRRLSADSARAHSRALSAETHVAGTPAQRRTRDYVLEQIAGDGATDRGAQLLRVHAARDLRPTVAYAPTEKELPLAEPFVVGDSTSGTWQYPTVNGYSGAGEAVGEVVYVNYGLIEDYARLDSLGVSVRGRIVVARYGRSFRGIKAREAERHGAAALVIYSDPQSDGYVRGTCTPKVRLRNWNGVQRGSVFNGAGDPATRVREHGDRSPDSRSTAWRSRVFPSSPSRTRTRASPVGASRPRRYDWMAGRTSLSLSRRSGTRTRPYSRDGRPGDQRERSRLTTPLESSWAASCPTSW